MGLVQQATNHEFSLPVAQAGEKAVHPESGPKNRGLPPNSVGPKFITSLIEPGEVAGLVLAP